MTESRWDWGVITTAAALSLVLISNLVDIGRFHASMEDMRKQQDVALVTGKRVEAQLDALATGTQTLAGQGNANAQAVLLVLQQNGVQIRPKTEGSATESVP